MTELKLLTGEVVLLDLAEHHRADAKVCEPCDLDVSTEALVNLVYTFEACSCGDPEYTHLTERLWHRDCFRHPTDEGEST
jgi:hypothetical protein